MANTTLYIRVFPIMVAKFFTLSTWSLLFLSLLLKLAETVTYVVYCKCLNMCRQNFSKKDRLLLWLILTLIPTSSLSSSDWKSGKLISSEEKASELLRFDPELFCITNSTFDFLSVFGDSPAIILNKFTSDSFAKESSTFLLNCESCGR